VFSVVMLQGGIEFQKVFLNTLMKRVKITKNCIQGYGNVKSITLFMATDLTSWQEWFIFIV